MCRWEPRPTRLRRHKHCLQQARCITRVSCGRVVGEFLSAAHAHCMRKLQLMALCLYAC
jgi:hypothetical protein